MMCSWYQTDLNMKREAGGPEGSEQRPLKRPLVSTNDDTSNVTNFFIPPDTSTIVIGPRGSTVRDIVRNTKCRITVASELRRPIVVLTGTVPERLNALADIWHLILRASTQEQPLSILIPDRCVGVILGKSGSHIKQISERTQAHLSFARETYPEELMAPKVLRAGPQKELTITGPFESTIGALDIILHRLDTEVVQTRIDPLKAQMSQFGPNPHLSRGGLGLLSHPGGQAVDQTKFQQNPLSYVCVAPAYGQVMQQAQQYSQITMQTDPFGQHPFSPGMGRRGGDGRAQPDAQDYAGLGQQPFPNKQAFPNLMVSIPKDQVGSYIGKHGAHIRELERESGALISIESSKGEGQTASIVTFQGTVEQNITAYKLTVQTIARMALAHNDAQC